MSTRLTTLALALTIALASAAHAQEPTPPATVEQLRNFIAHNLDALVVGCPAGRKASDDAACYRIGSSADHHRWQLERWRAGYSDLEWVDAWFEIEPGVVARLLLMTPSSDLPRWVYALSISEASERYETIGWVLDLGAAD